jgi:hypothetical protein
MSREKNCQIGPNSEQVFFLLNKQSKELPGKLLCIIHRIRLWLYDRKAARVKAERSEWLVIKKQRLCQRYTSFILSLFRTTT